MKENTTKSRTQLAILMGKSESSISRWMNAGCPYTVVCDGTLKKRPMFNVDEVQAWLATQARRACYGKRKGVKQ